MKISFKILFFLMIGVTALWGCSSDDAPATSSGSGGGGSTTFSDTPAEITAATEDDLAKAAGEGAKQAVAVSTAPGAVGVSLGDSAIDLKAVADIVLGTLSQASVTGVQVPDVCISGSVDVTQNSASGATITYSDCQIETNVTVNGQAVVTTSSDGDSTTITYSNFTISGLTDELATLNNTSITCSGLNSSTPTCNYSSEFTGATGTYRVSNVTVSGNSSSGYNIAARVSTTNIGYIEVQTTSPITLNCPNGLPDSGSLTITGSNGNSISVTFSGCSSFTVTNNGVANTYTW